MCNDIFLHDSNGPVGCIFLGKRCDLILTLNNLYSDFLYSRIKRCRILACDYETNSGIGRWYVTSEIPVLIPIEWSECHQNWNKYITLEVTLPQQTLRNKVYTLKCIYKYMYIINQFKLQLFSMCKINIFSRGDQQFITKWQLLMYYATKWCSSHKVFFLSSTTNKQICH